MLICSWLVAVYRRLSPRADRKARLTRRGQRFHNPAIMLSLEERAMLTIDLAPAQFGGWDNAIIPATQRGTTTSELTLTEGDPLFVDAGWANFGPTSTSGTFRVNVSVSSSAGNFNQTVTQVIGQNQGIPNTDIDFGFLSAGSYTITMTIDADNTQAESNESNNTHSRNITVNNTNTGSATALTVPVADIVTATAASWSSTAASVAAAGEFDVYSISLASASGVFFDIDAKDTGLSNLNSDITILNSSGVVIAGNAEGFDFEGFAVPDVAADVDTIAESGFLDPSLYLDLAAGNYFVVVGGAGTSTGAYELRTLADTNYATSIPVLDSLAGAADTLYLDFDGHTSSGTAWGSFTAAAFDFNSSAAQYSPAERLAMKNIWRVMAEDYSPFNINVSTVVPASFNNGVGYRMIITNSDATIVGQSSGTLGVAYLTGYASVSDGNQGFTFANNFNAFTTAGLSGRIMAAAVEQGNTSSHEFGHALGLKHYNTQTPPTTTAGSATLLPATIMSSPDLSLSREIWGAGNADDRPDPQNFPNDTTVIAQDDMAIISNGSNTFGYRADDHGNATGTATVLTASGNTYSSNGIIGNLATPDRDYFSFVASGSTTITVNVDEYVNNLDVELRLFDSVGTLIGTHDVTTSFDAVLTQVLSAGTYFIEVRSDEETGSLREAGQYSVAISTQATNSAPNATNLNAAESYTEDTPLNLIDIVITDADSPNVTAQLTLSNPAAGSLNTATSGSVTSTYVAGTGVWTASGALANVNTLLAGLTFTPAANFNANFSIATSVSDGVAAAITGSKAMTGVAVNDVPVAQASSVTTNEDTAKTFATSDFLFSDVESNGLASITIVTRSLASGDTLKLSGVDVTNGQSITVANIPNLVYTPANNANGSARSSFTFRANDAGNGTVAATMSINVTAVNDAPAIANQTLSTPENVPNGTVVGTVAASDVDAGQTLTYSITGGNTSGAFAINPTTGALSIANTNVINFETNPSFNLTVQVTDNGTPVLSTSATITVNITDVNEAPNLLLTPDSLFVDENTSTAGGLIVAAITILDDALGSETLSLTGSDASFFEIVSNNLRIKSGTALNFEVKDNYSVTVNIDDSTVGTNPDGSQSFTLFLNDVNDLPVALASSVSTSENVAKTFAVSDFLFNDADGDSLASITIAALSLASGDTLKLSGVDVNANQTITAANIPNLVYTPATNANGTARSSFTFRANDADNGTVAATMTINVGAVNTAPSATNLSTAETYTEDTPLNLIDIVVTDVDSATVTAQLTLSNTAAGSLNTATSGSVTSTYVAGTGVWTASGAIADVNILLAGLTFTPAANFNSNFTIATSVSDGVAPAVTGSKAMTGTPVNDVPVALASNVTTNEDTAKTFAAGDFSFTDVEGHALVSITIATLSLASGDTLKLSGVDVTAGQTIAVGSLSNLVYTPAANANGSARSSFTFRANDAGNGTVAATMTINVTAVNDSPVILAQSLTTTENSANGTVVGTVTATDPDVGQTLSYAITAGNTSGAFAINPSTGQVSVANSAALDFETNPIFSLTVSATDNGSPILSSSATVTVKLLNQFEVTASALQSIVPLYQYPLSAPNTLSDWWQRISVAATADRPVTVVINPNSGPINPAVGGADYNNYVTGLSLLRANPNVRILGYIATGFGSTSPATILQHAGWYAEGYKHSTTGASLIDGVFLDEMSNNVSHVAAYSSVATGIRSINGLAGHMIAGNPGTSTPEDYLTANTADLFIIREGTLPDLLNNAAPAYVTSPAYNHLSFGAIVHSVSGATDLATALREFKLRGLDFGFVTDDTAPNEYDQAPTFFENYLRDIHAPYVNTPAPVNLAENSANGTAVLTVAAGDPDPGQTLSYSITSGNTGGAFAIHPTSGQITVANMAALDFETHPTFSLTVQVSDNGTPVLSDAVTIVINLTNINEVPVAQASSVTTIEDTAKTFAAGDFLFTDPEGNALVSITIATLSLASGDTLKLSGVDVTAGQTITAANIPNLVYTPNPNSNGSARSSFTFQANDAGNGTVAAAMTINVTAVNDVPVALASSVTTNEDTAKTFATGDFLFTDVEGNSLVSITIATLSLASGDALKLSGVDVTAGQIIAVGNLANLVYTPAANANGNARSSFTFRANDADNGTVAATMTINVTAVNDDSLVINAGNWISSLAFNTANSANGGVRIHQDPGRYDSGVPVYRVQPYFANLGVTGLLESSYTGKLAIGRGAIEWYLANLESDGTMLDHWYRADGSVPLVDAKTSADSHDSYASTALMMIDAYIRAGGDYAFLNTPTNLGKIDAIVGVLIGLQQSNGLTWARSNVHTFYTQDNSESYGGFVAAANIEASLAQRPERILDYQTRADRVRNGILTDLYDSSTGLFRVAELGNTANLTEWYPGTQHLVWPMLFGVVDPGSAIAQTQFASLDSAWDGSPQPDWTTTRTDDGGGVGLGALMLEATPRALAYADNVAVRHFATSPATPQGIYTPAEAGFFLRMLTPLIKSTSISTNEDTAVSATLDGIDLQSETLTFTVSVQPQHGTLTSFDPQTGNFSYLPDPNYSGADSFRAYVSDGQNRSLDRVFHISVLAVNDVPVAQASSVTTNEDTAKTFAASDFTFTDVEGNPLTSITIGTLSLASGDTLKLSGVDVTAGQTISAANIADLVYAPASNAHGSARSSFTFRANDAGNGSVAATMTVNVTAVNDVPVAQASSVTTSEDTAKTFASSDFLFNDVEGHSLVSITIATLSLASGDTLKLSGVDVTAEQTITVGNIPNLVYTPAANTNGTARSSFTFRANDADIGTVAAAMTINVTAVNDVPVAQPSSVTTNEDTAKSFAVGDFAFTDVEGHALVSITLGTLSLASGDTLKLSGVDITNGQTIIAAAIPNLVYTPAANAHGNARSSFTFKVNDADLGIVAAAMTINVTAVNDVPVAQASSVTTDEDTAKTFDASDFAFTDVEGNPLASVTIATLSLASGDTLKLSGVDVTAGQTITAASISNLVYAPAANASGNARSSFTFRANDAGNGTVTATMTINVTAVNDVPVALASSVTTNEDTAKTFAASDFAFSDTEGNALVSITLGTLSLASGDTLRLSGVDVTAGQTIIAANISSLVYTPAANANGTARSSFTFRANDASNGTVAATMTINVTAVNDVPVALASSVTTNEDTAKTFAVSDFSFSDTEGNALVSITIATLSLASGDTLKLSGVDVTAGQTITAASIPNLVYTPAANANGNARSSFTFRVNDADLGTVAATMTMNVTPETAAVTFIDDGDAGFAVTGTWGSVSGFGFGSDARIGTGSDGNKKATWTFSGLSSGQYRIEATWLSGADRATNAPYAIRDGVGGAIVGNAVVNQRVNPAGATSQGGRPFTILGTVSITGGVLVVELTNTATNGAIVADAVRIVSVTPPPNTPEVDVLDGAASLTDGTNYDFGQAVQGTTVTRTFTVKNIGTANLTLQPITVSGSAFSLTSANFTAGQLLAPNATATITVALNTSSLGTFTGGLSFGNSDADEGPFDLTFTGKVNPVGATTFTLDDGDAGFAVTGTWSSVSGFGYGSDARSATGTDGSKKATWTFSGLTAGEYRVATTWLSGADRANNAPYVIRDGVGGPVLSNLVINQRVNPSGATSEGGRPFSSLGTVIITGTTLVVELSNSALNGAVIADAVRIERITAAPNTPRLDVKAGAATLLDNGTLNLGSATQGGAAVTKTITVKNTGTADLILQPITIGGAGFSLVSTNFTAGQTLAPNATVDITVQLSTATAGTFNGTLSFGHNDGGPFDLALTGTINVAQPPGVFLIDDGDSGFSLTSTWTNVAGYGYGADAKAATGTTGTKIATWNFIGLTAGTYRIAATWLSGGDRATNAPYTFKDGATTVGTASVNQRVNPSGGPVVPGGRPFSNIGTVTITGTTLVIELANLPGTNGAIIADAIRIEKLSARLANPAYVQPDQTLNTTVSQLEEPSGPIAPVVTATRSAQILDCDTTTVVLASTKNKNPETNPLARLLKKPK